MQNSFVDILAQLEPEIKPAAQFQQSEPARSQLDRFREFYRDQRLTECLEILEQQDLRGDAAILVLSMMGRY